MIPNTGFRPFPVASFRQQYPKNRPLGPNFQPGPHDVICGRGKAVFWHKGNQELRRYIGDNVERYQRAKSKLDKSLIVIEIVDRVRSRSPNGGFVKHIAREPPKGTGRQYYWVEVGDALAREKVGHYLRDAVNGKEHPSKPPHQAGFAIMDRVVKRTTSQAVSTNLGDRGERDTVVSSMMVASRPIHPSDDLEPLDVFNNIDCATLNIDMSCDPYHFIRGCPSDQQLSSSSSPNE